MSINIDWKFAFHRAGELSPEELDRLTKVITDPRSYKIPDWFLNRQKDIKDGKYSQVISSALDSKLRDDFERMKKIRFVSMGSLFDEHN